MNAIGHTAEKRRVNGMVEPLEVYSPHIVTTTWFKTWAFKCGWCSREVVSFAVFGKPRCPFCRTKNAPQFQTYF